MSNDADFHKMVGAVEAAIIGRDDPFRANLGELARKAGVSNTPTRKLFDMTSDILTLNAVIDRIGEWCVAEIEGLNVQFNPVVTDD